VRRAVPVLFAALAVLAVGVGPVAAHGNHIDVDDQVGDDGDLLVETVYVTEGSSWHVVVHAHNGTGPGEPIGHRTIDPGPKTGFTVPIDADHWREFSENTTVWVTLHRDDVDGSFDPAAEPVFVDQFDQRRARQIAVGKRDTGRVNVVAHGFSGQRTVNTSAVTVPRVSLAESSAVELYAVGENDSFGPRVGRTTFDAGVSENVTIQVEESFFAEQGDRFELRVAAAHGDTPVEVGDERVASRFGVEKGVGIEESEDHGHDSPHGTPTPDSTSDASATGSGTASVTDRQGEPTPTQSTGDGPGLGVLAALVAMLAVVAWRRTRN